MKKYEVGQEIAPGVTAEIVQERWAIGISSGKHSNINTSVLDAIASLGEQIESLKRQVPTEWRTGVPDWDSLHEFDLIQYEVEGWGYTSVGINKFIGKNGDWDNTVHRIIPYVAPPAPPQPKVLTVDDLPTFDGRVQWSFLYADLDGDNALNPWKIYAIIEDTEVPISDWYGSKHAAVEAAIAAVEEGKLDQFLNGGGK